MAIGQYDEAVNLLKQIKGEESAPKTEKARPKSQMAGTVRQGDDISAYEDALYGSYDETQEKGYSQGQTLLNETLKEVESGNISEETSKRLQERIKNSSIPTAILESVIKNPIIATMPEDGYEDDAVSERVKEKLETQRRINRYFAEQDRKEGRMQVTESKESNTPTVSYESIDYEKIRSIVESTVDKKLGTLRKQFLTESTAPSASIKGVVMTDGGKFRMVDSEGKIYECTMTYIGKQSKKK